MSTISSTISNGITIGTPGYLSPLTITAQGMVSNSSGYAISSTSVATVVNAGHIVGNQLFAISLYAGGSVTNQSGGTISGSHGVFANAVATVVNAGSIGGNDVPGAGMGIYLNAGGSVTNQSGGAISGGVIGVYGYTAISVVNAGNIAGNFGIDLHEGGSVTDQAGGTISGGYAGISSVYAYSNFGPGGGAATVVNAGVITGGTYAVQMRSGYTNRLVVDPGAEFIGTVTGGNTIGAAAVSTLELGSGSSKGTLTGLGSHFINFGSIAFDDGADWFVEGSTAGLAGSISGFAAGDTIEVTGITVTGSSYAGGVLTLDEASGSTSLNLVGDFTANEFVVTNVAGGAEVTALCFCVNTLIETPTGARPVQDLAAGDLVVTAGGAARPIAWVGTGSILAARGRRSAATPVIVRKGALSDNVPYQDLRVTKGHSLLIDDVLIPVEFLVNHRSILWDDRAQEVTLYHIELETHDLLVANGASAESYRDDGNRWLFQNANTGWDQPAKPPCAPVLTGGPIVDAAWRRLLDRAGGAVRMPLTDEADLHLLVDGERVDAVRWEERAFVFNLAAVPASVRIVSRAAAPQELGLARDPRCLGVALRQIAVRQGARRRAIQANDSRLVSGFHRYEGDNAFVWTDGDATLPMDGVAGSAGPVEIVLTVASTTRYIDEGVRQCVA